MLSKEQIQIIGDIGYRYQKSGLKVIFTTVLKQKAPSFKWSQNKICLIQQASLINNQNFKNHSEITGLALFTGTVNNVIGLDIDNDWQNTKYIISQQFSILGITPQQFSIQVRSNNHSKTHILLKVENKNNIPLPSLDFYEVVNGEKKTKLQLKGDGKLITVAPHYKDINSFLVRHKKTARIDQLKTISERQYKTLIQMLKNKWSYQQSLLQQKQVQKIVFNCKKSFKNNLKQEKKNISTQITWQSIANSSIQFKDDAQQIIDYINDTNNIQDIIESLGYTVFGDGYKHPWSNSNNTDTYVDSSTGIVRMFGASDELRKDIGDNFTGGCAATSHMVILSQEFKWDFGAMMKHYRTQMNKGKTNE